MLVFYILLLCSGLLAAQAQQQQNFAGCSADQTRTIRRSVRAAQKLARQASASINTISRSAATSAALTQLWALYFNDDTAQAGVAAVFDAISRYPFEQAGDQVNWLCDSPSAPAAACADNQTSAAAEQFFSPPYETNVRLCPYFFGSLNVSDACLQPGPDAPTLADAPMVVLHELAHSRKLTGQSIADYAYSYPAVTALAQARDPSKLPENNANSYAFYAAAVRYLRARRRTCYGPDPLFASLAPAMPPPLR